MADEFGQAVERAEAPRHGVKIQTLEDLYDQYPRVGDGDFFLRICRLEPRAYNGTSISGFIEDLHNKISLREFSETYGGGRYEVSVMGSGDRLDADGNPQVRTLVKVNFKIQGHPSLEKLPKDSMNSAQQPIMMQNGQEAPSVAIAKINAEQKSRETEREERRYAESRAREEAHSLAKELSAQHEKSLEAVRAAGEAQAKAKEDTLRRLQHDYDKRGDELQKLREEVVSQKTMHIEQLRSRELEIEKRMGDLHEKSVKALMDAQREKLAELNERFREDTMRREVESSRERERLRADQDLALSRLRETYESQITSLKFQMDRESTASSRTAQYSMDAVKTNMEATMAAKSASFETQINMLQMQLSQANTDRDSYRREAEELRQKLNRDPLSVIKESQEMARLTGMVLPSEVEEREPAEPSEEESIGKMLVKGAATALSQAPQLVKTIMDQNQQQRASAQAEVAHVQQQQQLARRRPVTRRLPPSAATPRTQTPPWASSPAAFASPVAPPVRFESTHPPPDGPRAGSVMDDVSPAIPPPAPLPSAPPPADVPASADDKAKLQFLASQIDSAFKSEIPAEHFAKSAVEQIGVDMVRELIGLYPPDRFLENCLDMDIALHTLIGKQYVREIWRVAATLIQ